MKTMYVTSVTKLTRYGLCHAISVQKVQSCVIRVMICMIYFLRRVPYKIYTRLRWVIKMQMLLLHSFEMTLLCHKLSWTLITQIMWHYFWLHKIYSYFFPTVYNFIIGRALKPQFCLTIPLFLRHQVLHYFLVVSNAGHRTTKQLSYGEAIFLLVWH